MHSRQIASLQVSAVGLGCMNLSFGYGAAPDGAAEAVLPRALDLGCTFLDTATMYGAGDNERLIGRVLAARRHEFVLASKCGMSKDGIDGRPATLAQQIDASLQRLRTDVIDLYYLHRSDPDVPIEESVGAMGRMVEQGKVREIGLSEVSTSTYLRAQQEHPIAAVQSEYSLWSRTPEHGLLTACRERGTAFVPFSPLGRQFLTGKACDVRSLPENDLRSTIARPRFEPAAFAANAALLVPMARIAEREGCSCAQLALAWLLGQPGSLIPIPGTKHVDWLTENLAAADIELDADSLAELDALINEQSVTGTRYTPDRMASTDSERDRIEPAAH